uniref:G-protein coupled receptor 4-like n=1 Tax=Semicossyphus pulcher TaxID=241346 RepID=UPI0037E775E1
MWNVTSLVGKEPELVREVERYQLQIVGLTSTHSSGSGTNILERGWTLAFSGVAQVRVRVWEEFGEALEKEFRLASKKFWQTVRRLRKGKQGLAQAVFSRDGELLTRTKDIVGRWKERFEELLNPAKTSSDEEADIIICIGFPLTLVAIYALHSLVRNDHVAPMFIINLLISDLIQLCCMIFDSGHVFTYHFSHEHTFACVYIYSLMASVCFMVCLSLERYLLIVHPLRCRFVRSIKISVVFCVGVWALPLVFLLPHYFRVDFHVTETIFFLVFLLPFPLLIFFLVGTLKSLTASISVPSNEKQQIVGILVMVLLIYTLLFLPSIICCFSALSIMFIRLSPLADLILCVFMSKGSTDKLLAFLCCCKMDSNDIDIATVTA